MRSAARTYPASVAEFPKTDAALERGIAGYPWRRFVFWDVLGEVLWVVLYVMLGYIFSDRVQYISEILGNLAWAIFALIVAIVLGWKLFRYFRPAGSVTA